MNAVCSMAISKPAWTFPSPGSDSLAHGQIGAVRSITVERDSRLLFPQLGDCLQKLRLCPLEPSNELLMVVAINRALSLDVLKKGVLRCVHSCFCCLDFFYGAHRSSFFSLLLGSIALLRSFKAAASINTGSSTYKSHSPPGRLPSSRCI